MLLRDKKALVVGIASKRSIAWGIAEAMAREGAELALSYQDERLQTRVEEAARLFGAPITAACDLGSDEQIAALFAHIQQHWDGIDIIVHAAAFAPREELEGPFIESCSRRGFQIAHDISSYSFTALAQAAMPLLKGRSASLLTLTFMGAERAVPRYNVMGLAKASLEANVRYMAHSMGPSGIRVNAISAGPIQTLAASGIQDFRQLLKVAKAASPMRRNVTIEEVGNAAAFLCSDMASGITGEIMYVDNGVHISAMADL